jgi:hypothetical protein
MAAEAVEERLALSHKQAQAVLVAVVRVVKQQMALQEHRILAAVVVVVLLQLLN